MSSTRYKAGLEQGERLRGLLPHFSWDSNYVIRDLVSDIGGGFFFIIWRIDITNKEQLSKLLLRLLILDSFPAISEDFKSIFAFKRSTQKPTARKRGTLTSVLNLTSANFLVQSLNSPFFPPISGLNPGGRKEISFRPPGFSPFRGREEMRVQGLHYLFSSYW